VTSDWKADVAVALAALLAVSALALLSPVSIWVALACLLVVTAIGAVSPLGLLMAVTVVLPYFYRPLDISNQQFAASELLLLCLIPAVAIRTVLELFTHRTNHDEILARLIKVFRERQVQVLIVLAVVGAALLATVDDSFSRSAGMREWRWTLLLPLFFVTFLAIYARTRMSHLLLVLSLSAAGVIAALHGFLDVATDSGVLVDNVRRLSGPSPHPNALAMFLVRPLVLAAALSTLIPRWRPVMVPVALLTGVATLGTFSRGALLAALVAFAILSIQVQPRIRYVLGTTTAVVLGLMFVLAGDRMRSALEGGSVSLRLDIWTASAHMIRDSPVVGYGPDQFLYNYAPRYILPGAWDERFTAHAHNLVADSWIRLGIVGAVIASAAFVIVIIHLLRSRWNIVDVYDFRFPALVTIAAVLVYGLVDNVYFSHDLAMSLWLLSWLALSCREPSGQLFHD
jgi:putative inorganic carbon (hco3(-)) transporter